jgi:hypothetical protein
MLSSLSREEYLKKRRNKRLTRYGILLFLCICIVSLVSYIAHRPGIRISKVELHGQILVNPSELQVSALKFMDGSYFWLFPKDNFLWYPKTKLTHYLKDTFKRIDTIHVEKKGVDTIIVTIIERKPDALWCEGLPGGVQLGGSVTDREGGNTEDSSPKCYYMDSNGTIFDEAPNFSGDAYFKYYGLVEAENPIGQFYIASSTEFSDITHFVYETRKLNLDPQYIVAKSGGEFSLFIFGGGQIYFDVKAPLEKATDNLEALLRTPALKNLSNLDYIDLRFGNKLYYKLRTQ